MSAQPLSAQPRSPQGSATAPTGDAYAVVDPRGLRFAAALTTVVLAAVLLTGSVWLLAAQAVVFALSVADRSPYGLIFRRLVRPRLGPPAVLEDSRPPRFAQGVGLAFALLGVIGFAAGSTTLGLTATAAALVAAFLNAAFGVCLGCELYLLFRRTSPQHKEVSR
jgi:Ca2+/Na+ antiporter